MLEEIVMELSVFKRALRGEDKIAFDNLMNKARSHASKLETAQERVRLLRKGISVNDLRSHDHSLACARSFV